MIRGLGVAGVCLLVLGCGGSSWQSGVTERAAFDLSCPREKISTTPLVQATNVAGQPMNGAKVGADGCGKKAVYVYDEDHGWIMNGASSKAE